MRHWPARYRCGLPEPPRYRWRSRPACGRRRAPRKTVLMSGAIEFAGSTMNCLVRNISISGAALDVTDPLDIPERFDLVFKADGTKHSLSCHLASRGADRRSL